MTEATMPPELMTRPRADALIAAHTRPIAAESLCKEPRVSVCLVTYRQERFIRQTLDGVLMQETAFPVEIVVGDDHSPDGTTDIVLDYQRQHPEQVRILLAEENLGRYTGNGRLNFVRTLEACRGKYVALLEGDDYWTDPNKLQKQVDFLEAHPEFSLCFHAVEQIDEEGNQPPLRFPPQVKAVSTLEDLLDGENFIPTCSMLFRRACLPSLPDWYFQVAMGDWPLACMLAEKGNLGYLDEVLGVYRVHSSSLWSSKPFLHRGVEVVRMLDCLRAYFGSRHEVRIARTQVGYLLHLAREARQVGQPELVRQHLARGLECLLAAEPDQAMVYTLIDEVLSEAGRAQERGALYEYGWIKQSRRWRLCEFLVQLPGVRWLVGRFG